MIYLLAIWAALSWTSQGGDSLRLVQVRAPGDTIERVLYSARSASSPRKRPSQAGARDSGFVSISTVNCVEGTVRLVLVSCASGKCSPPSNPASCFYAARDTAYLGPDDWTRGRGLRVWRQAYGDAAWPFWQHQERVQQVNLARLCALYGYAARRGARDSAWCAP